MVRAMSVILGLAFLAMGILGLTGIMPMFTSGLVYVNVGQIVLGALGLAVGIYARQSGDYRLKRENDLQRKENDQQKQESYNQQKQEISQQRQQNEEQRKEYNDLQRKENDRLRKKTG